MTTSATSRTGRAVRRVKRVVAEFDYVERRLFEMRTGVPARAERRPRISRSIEELERLYAA
ncbi:MAG TPA: hypothetical protein VEF89_20765 [Solirubrobacteraceae bacterium]|nr:hypothetical protein [Solirubrobacteraceae bacterium]